MSKAELRALEAYHKDIEEYVDVNGVKSVVDNNSWQRAIFLKGYHQAEKDLALTIEDIEKIDNLLWDLSSKWSGKNDNAGYFQEVLNRFNEQKGEEKMIYDEQNESCIIYEKERLKDNDTQCLVSFYNNHPCCEGDVVIKDEIYEVKNPYWLSDTFVFCKRHYNDVFLVGEVDLVCYIKVNIHNQIEEIGTNFERRFGQDLKDKKQASNLHKIMFTLIGDEYWLELFFRERKGK